MKKYNGWEDLEWRKYWGVDYDDEFESDPIEELFLIENELNKTLARC